MDSPIILPYWQINVPPPHRTSQCPPFLLNLSPKDLSIISTPDTLYQALSWPSVRSLIASNRIDLFQRAPSSLRRYLAYNHTLKEQYGSVMAFVLQQRLHWDEPAVPAGRPWEKEEDVKILCNDWPYGIDARIVHLVVWTKFVLEDDPATDDLTVEARRGLDAYVRRVFEDRVIWFKNWRSLKSVHAVEHFHVMLFDPDPEFVREVTRGDVPLSEKVDVEGGLLDLSQGS